MPEKTLSNKEDLPRETKDKAHEEKRKMDVLKPTKIITKASVESHLHELVDEKENMKPSLPPPLQVPSDEPPPDIILEPPPDYEDAPYDDEESSLLPSASALSRDKVVPGSPLSQASDEVRPSVKDVIAHIEEHAKVPCVVIVLFSQLSSQFIPSSLPGGGSQIL